MRTTISRKTCLSLGLSLAVGGLVLASTPVFAQSVRELTVTGRYGTETPRSLSRVVSYRDLNLASKAGADALKLRINDTAKDLCRELGEPQDAGGAAGGCRQDAVDHAMPQVRAAIADAGRYHHMARR